MWAECRGLRLTAWARLSVEQLVQACFPGVWGQLGPGGVQGQVPGGSGLVGS